MSEGRGPPATKFTPRRNRRTTSPIRNPMNVAKPGGPAGPAPSSPDGAGGASGLKPAGSERSFSDVLANKPGNPGQTQGANRPEPFKAPILDDGPVRMSSQNVSGIQRTNFVDRTQRVNAPSR